MKNKIISAVMSEETIVSRLRIETIEYGKFIGCFNDVFYGTAEECVAYYNAYCKGKRAEILTNTDFGAISVTLPENDNEWREVWCKDPDDERGTKRVFEIALNVTADKTEDKVKDDLDFDFDPIIPITRVFIRSENENEALQIAQAMYPNSTNGYNITCEVRNRNYANNDISTPSGREFLEKKEVKSAEAEKKHSVLGEIGKIKAEQENKKAEKPAPQKAKSHGQEI